MYNSVTTHHDPQLGKCEKQLRLEDDGSAVVTLKEHVGTPEETMVAYSVLPRHLDDLTAALKQLQRMAIPRQKPAWADDGEWSGDTPRKSSAAIGCDYEDEDED